MTLHQYQNELTAHIERQEEVLEQLASQIQQLQMELRWDKKKLNDQGQIQKEVDKWLNQGRKLMEDACGAFPKEAMQDISRKVEEIASSIEEKYEELEQSYTYLMREVEQPPTIKALEQTAKQERNVEVVVENESIVNEDGTLTANGVEELTNDFSMDILHKIASMIGTRASKRSTIAKALADSKITEEGLIKMVEAAEMLTKNTYLAAAS